MSRTESAADFTGLLVAGDPAPVIVENEAGPAGFLFVCDHAGRAVPRKLGDLGLPPAAFERHIAYDIGAGAVSQAAARLLDACVIRQTYSRLVIDCNRAPERADLIVEASDGTAIPGNLQLDAASRAIRIAAIHHPYHARIRGVLDRRAARDAPTIVVAVHSFTPVMNGDARPWHMGVLHMGDSELSRRMLQALSADPGLVVGDNQPYVMDEVDFTVPLHAQRRGLDYLEIEIRQDLIADAEGQNRMAALLARALAAT